MVDEKVTLRTEEFPCPITGEPHLRTVEVVEKVIETEVRLSIFLLFLYWSSRFGFLFFSVFILLSLLFIFLFTEKLKATKKKKKRKKGKTKAYVFVTPYFVYKTIKIIGTFQFLLRTTTIT